MGIDETDQVEGALDESTNRKGNKSEERTFVNLREWTKKVQNRYEKKKQREEMLKNKSKNREEEEEPIENVKKIESISEDESLFSYKSPASEGNHISFSSSGSDGENDMEIRIRKYLNLKIDHLKKKKSKEDKKANEIEEEKEKEKTDEEKEIEIEKEMNEEKEEEEKKNIGVENNEKNTSTKGEILLTNECDHMEMKNTMMNHVEEEEMKKETKNIMEQEFKNDIENNMLPLSEENTKTNELTVLENGEVEKNKIDTDKKEEKEEEREKEKERENMEKEYEEDADEKEENKGEEHKEMHEDDESREVYEEEINVNVNEIIKNEDIENHNTNIEIIENEKEYYQKSHNKEYTKNDLYENTKIDIEKNKNYDNNINGCNKRNFRKEDTSDSMKRTRYNDINSPSRQVKSHSHDHRINDNGRNMYEPQNSYTNNSDAKEKQKEISNKEEVLNDKINYTTKYYTREKDHRVTTESIEDNNYSNKEIFEKDTLNNIESPKEEATKKLNDSLKHNINKEIDTLQNNKRHESRSSCPPRDLQKKELQITRNNSVKDNKKKNYSIHSKQSSSNNNSNNTKTCSVSDNYDYKIYRGSFHDEKGSFETSKGNYKYELFVNLYYWIFRI